MEGKSKRNISRIEGDRGLHRGRQTTTRGREQGTRGDNRKKRRRNENKIVIGWQTGRKEKRAITGHTVLIRRTRPPFLFFVSLVM